MKNLHSCCVPAVWLAARPLLSDRDIETARSRRKEHHRQAPGRSKTPGPASTLLRGTRMTLQWRSFFFVRWPSLSLNGKPRSVSSARWWRGRGGFHLCGFNHVPPAIGCILRRNKQRYTRASPRNAYPLFDAMESGDGTAVVIPPSPEAVVGPPSDPPTKTLHSSST